MKLHHWTGQKSDVDIQYATILVLNKSMFTYEVEYSYCGQFEKCVKHQQNQLKRRAGNSHDIKLILEKQYRY